MVSLGLSLGVGVADVSGVGGGSMWPNIIKKANSLLLFVDIIYIFTKIVRKGFVPSLKGGGQIEEIIK